MSDPKDIAAAQREIDTSNPGAVAAIGSAINFLSSERRLRGASTHSRTQCSRWVRIETC